MWKIALHTDGASKHLRKPLWAFSCQPPSASAEQAAVEAPGTQKQPWQSCCGPWRGAPAWHVRAGEARGLWDHFFANCLLRRKTKRSSGNCAVASREAGEDGAESPSLHPGLQGSCWLATSPLPSPSPCPPCCSLQGAGGGKVFARVQPLSGVAKMQCSPLQEQEKESHSQRS